VGGKLRTSFNLIMTMILAGLWHGANWTFVIFGAIHGVVLSLERLIFPVAKEAAGAVQARGIGKWLSIWGQRILTFNVFCLSLAYFRATSLAAATEYLRGLSNLAWRSEYGTAFLMLSLFAVPLFIVDLLMEASNQEYPFANSSCAFRTALATASFVVLALFSGSNLNAFVYFRF
jgi:alginate O-acetyltransferase complex protein AlgI